LNRITFSFTSSFSLFYLTLLNLVHLRTSDLGKNKKTNSKLNTSFIVDLD